MPTNDKWEWEKSFANGRWINPIWIRKKWFDWWYDFDCAELPASTNGTIGVTHTPAFNLCPFGLGLAEFINLGRDFNAALTASTTSTTGTNENKITMKYECRQDGPHSHTHTQTQAQHLTTPVIDSNDKIDATAVASREINNAESVFGGILWEYQIYHHVNEVFDDDFSENFYDNYFLSPGMLFWIFLYICLTI